jgi:hypothetical protein
MSKKEDNHVFIEGATGVHHYEIVGRDATGSRGSSSSEDFSTWGDQPLNLGDFKVIPFGTSNDIPKQIQDIVFPNHLAGGVQERKVELLMGQGPYVFTEEQDGRNYARKANKDAEVINFLETNQYEDHLECNATDFYYNNIIYTKISRSNAARLGISTRLPIAALAHLSAGDCRLAYKRSDLKELPTHVIIGDWNTGSNKTEDFEILPIWNPQEPTKYPHAVHISIRKSYGVPFYAIPNIFGALKWISRSTATPRILEAFTDNSLSVKWHIESPAEYWLDIENGLKKKHGTAYQDKMLTAEQNRIFEELTNVLSGIENSGKWWHNQYVTKLIGSQAKEQGWRITAIDQKIGDYVDSYLKIGKHADYSTLAGLGLHSALANVGVDGKSDSGSEQFYAYKIHKLTSIPLAERKVTKAYNDVLKVNFPSQRYKVGFLHIEAEREQDVTESQRITNQNPTP